MNQFDSSNGITKGRKWKVINEVERYKIEMLLKERYKPKEIAKVLGRDRRTIEREIQRGKVTKKIENPYLSRNPKVPDYIEKTFYSAKEGQKKADWMKTSKGRPLKMLKDKKLFKYIENKILNDNYAPDAVIGQLKRDKSSFSVMVCTKTVYNMIDRGDFYKITNKNLPIKRNKKHRKVKKICKVAKNNITGRSIEERDSKINNREEIGHWEMDLVIGKGSHCLLAFTERKTRKELIFKIPNKKQESIQKVLDTLETNLRGRFKTVFKSITTDNGIEFLNQEGIENSCVVKDEKRTVCYYAHPYSSWERGSNENANKLIRRFIAKGKNIDKYSDKEIKEIEDWINNYPRKIFGYRTANQMYNEISLK